MKKIIIIIIALALLVPQIGIASTNAEIEILKIKIRILELQIQRLMILLDEIRQAESIAIEESVEEETITSPDPIEKTEIEWVPYLGNLHGRVPAQR